MYSVVECVVPNTFKFLKCVQNEIMHHSPYLNN